MADTKPIVDPSRPMAWDQPIAFYSTSVNLNTSVMQCGECCALVKRDVTEAHAQWHSQRLYALVWATIQMQIRNLKVRAVRKARNAAEENKQAVIPLNGSTQRKIFESKEVHEVIQGNGKPRVLSIARYPGTHFFVDYEGRLWKPNEAGQLVAATQAEVAGLRTGEGVTSA